ncbi:hypothetical protein THAOC_01638, partial [Thalassiosira oceanica]
LLSTRLIGPTCHGRRALICLAALLALLAVVLGAVLGTRSAASKKGEPSRNVDGGEAPATAASEAGDDAAARRGMPGAFARRGELCRPPGEGHGPAGQKLCRLRLGSRRLAAPPASAPTAQFLNDDSPRRVMVLCRPPSDAVDCRIALKHETSGRERPHLPNSIPSGVPEPPRRALSIHSLRSAPGLVLGEIPSTVCQDARLEIFSSFSLEGPNSTSRGVLAPPRRALSIRGPLSAPVPVPGEQ